MKRLEVNKSAVTLFMIGLIVMSFFLPGLYPAKRFNNLKTTATIILKGLDRSSTGDQTQDQTSGNLLEEEEEEYTAETECILESQIPILITLSLSSPNLFFKDHYGEVSGPPPWS